MISAYLWGYKNYEAGSKSIDTFRKFYPNNDVFIRIDTDGDFENYKKSTIDYDVDIEYQKNKIGYPGNFEASGHSVGRDHWPYENLHTFLTSIYDCCKQTNSKYMIILEEDVFLLKAISIIDTEFGIAIAPNKNHFPNRMVQFILSLNGNILSNGYGACGGTIINTKQFIRGYELTMNPLKSEFDDISKYTHLVGWSDMMIQVIIMCIGGSVVVNNQLVEPWFQEKGWINDDWRNYELVNYLKDISLL
jgi:hypothetical protein